MAKCKSEAGPDGVHHPKYNFINPRYEDPHGDIVYNGVGATRVGPGRYMRYDGRLETKWTLFTKEQRRNIGNYKISGHAIAELAKGLLLTKPETFQDPIDIHLLEIAYQTAKASGYKEDGELADWMENNREMLMLLAEVMQTGKVSQALAMMRNHDEDIQRELPDECMEWREKHKTTIDEDDLRNQRMARTHWVRVAKQAKERVKTANRIKFATPLLHAPELDVTKTHNGKSLTDDDINAVEDDSRYGNGDAVA